MTDREERAQTGIDFLVGMSVFLIAVGFVFAFVPSMFAPFGGSGVNDALIADRSAAYLAEYALAEDPANPGVLSSACTAVFFDEDGNLNHTEIDEDHDCNFDPAQIDDLTVLFGLQNQDSIYYSGSRIRTPFGSQSRSLSMWEGKKRKLRCNLPM